MKNSINKVMGFVLTGSLIFTACDKKLSEYNPTGLTPDATYTTAKGFETLVNAAYTYTRFWYGKEEGYSLSEMGTDIWTNGTGDVFPQLSRYDNLQGSNTAALTLEWDNFYAAIYLCNTGISKIGEIPDYTAKQKLQREAELRFMRAFYYWHIVETWGGVHFTTEATAPGVIESTANKTPVETFYTQIFEDLNYAVKNLPATTTDYGRPTVTIPVAKAFLARMYLTRGMNTEAAAMANELIKNPDYMLLPKFADLWSMSNLKNKEVIWSIDYSTNLANNDLSSSAYPSGHSRGSNNGHMLFTQVYDQVNTSLLVRDIPNGRPFNRYMPTKTLLDLFNETDDSRYLASFQVAWLCNKEARTAGNSFNTKDTFDFKLGDTVCYTSKSTLTAASMNGKHYTTYDISRVYNAAGVPTNRKFYISLKKFLDPTRGSFNEAQSARDVFVIRLAEMYLIAAEANFNLGKPDVAAGLLNTLRTRAAIPGHEAAMQITPAQVTLDFILDERARELCGEQLRWFDLKRTNKLIDRVTRLNPDAAQYIKGYHTVRPIPQSQIDAVTNKSEFAQNQGYQ
ncbi:MULTISPECIES: RagB/SusD family nutrient uptake outer membrane protein [Niastella]|uniref:RagB/SusD family nutrient uptake outer membrane protein n=1 Tax=Niastella soli TaxID=2821487 RepID=A0ABS3YLL3_9BACT|nr:RagB/SusD family nutrient uptake outer membrane protein [Niastella soli]MBO9198783.1 RagB/SusD family nutrient uptake outer membrane protein [Niastella soli]